MTVSPGDTEDSSGHTKKEELAAGGHTPTIPTLGRLKQEDDHHELKASPGHTGPYPTEAKTEKMKYHACGKAVWDWGRKRGEGASISGRPRSALEETVPHCVSGLSFIRTHTGL